MTTCPERLLRVLTYDTSTSSSMKKSNDPEIGKLNNVDYCDEILACLALLMS